MSERVYSYFAYDGEAELPEEGVASFRDEPHYFWLREALLHPGQGLFDIAPIDAGLLSLVIEAEDMWHAWDLDYHAGRVELASHPAKAGINPRFVTLKSEISHAASVLRGSSFSTMGLFAATESFLTLAARLAGQRWPVVGMHSAELEVTWSDVQSPRPSEKTRA